MEIKNDIKVPADWGWCMGGAEEWFTNTIIEAATRCKKPVFRYLELGPAQMGTMKAVAQILAEAKAPSELVGVELPNDPFDMQHAWGEKRAWPADGINIQVHYIDTRTILELDSITAHRWDVIFVDACHCHECVTRDFEAAEKLVADNGFLICHDAAEACQENDLQSFHENRPLRVRRALKNLGLFNGARQGWKLVADLNHLHNGCAIFERVT